MRCTRLAVLAFRGVSRPSRGAGFIGPARRAAPLNVDPRFAPTQGASAPPPEHRQRGRFFGFGRDSGRAFHGQFTARDRNNQGRGREGISRPRYGTNLVNTAFLSSSAGLPGKPVFWFRPFDLLQALFGRPKRKERQETYRDFRENPCYNSQNSTQAQLAREKQCNTAQALVHSCANRATHRL